MNLFRPKLIGLSLLLAGISLCSYGQEQQAVTPPSPDAAAMMRSINIPVSHYTGTASVNIPFYTISTHGVQIPIMLGYQASGIKVNDMDTWVGLGWRLSTGGRVSRMVRGAQADEDGYSKTWGTPDGQEANNLSSWSTDKINQRNEAEFDSEPDLFFFEIPGKSGQFVADYNGNVHLIPYQGIRVEWNRTPYTSTFTITDENGNRYYFRDIEMTVSQDVDDKKDIKDWISSWNLSEIVTNQNDTIRYKYQSGDPFEEVITTHVRTNAANRVGTGWEFQTKKDETKSRKVTNYSDYLQSIEWSGGKLEYITEKPILNNKPWRLTEIKIYTQGKPIKSLQLSYGTFTNGASKLAAIAEKSGEEVEQVCRFEYNTSFQLPTRYSRDYDHWGYFNGNNSSKGGYIPAHEVFGHLVEGADRSPHWPQTMADMLTDIVYKGGGRKTFEYEANRAADGYFGEKIIYGGGVRIKRIIENVDNKQYATEYHYVKPTGGSSGEIYSGTVIYTSTDFRNMTPIPLQYHVYENSQNLIFDVNGVPIVYSEVKEIKPNGAYTINRYSSFKDPCRDSSALLYFPNSYGPGDPKLDYWGDGVIFPKSSRIWRRGLLLEQQQYTADDELVLSQINRYNLAAPQKGKVLGFIGLESYYGSLIRPDAHHVLGVYEWMSQPIYQDSTITLKGSYNLPASTAITYDTTYLTSKSVVQKDAEDNLFTSATTYPFDYGSQSGFATPMQSALTMMQRRNMRAAPIEQISYKNGKIVGAELTLFRMSLLPDSTVLADRKLSLKMDKPIDPNQFAKSSISASGTFAYDPRYEVTSIFDQYDNWGNPTCSHNLHGNYQSVIYGYNHSLPIAQVKNARNGGPEDYTTTQEYSFTGNTTPIVRSFSVNMAQTISLDVDLAVDSTITMGTDCSMNLVLHNTSSGETTTFTPSIQSPGGTSNCRFRFTIPVSAGSYTITLNTNMIPQITWSLAGRYSLSTLHHSDSRDKEIFHTSFEEGDDGTESPLAKTGNRIHNGTYSVDLRNFIPGTYRMIYWESSDNGLSWQRMDQTLTVASETTSCNVGVMGKIMDELRILPARAEMTTYTHAPGIGLTSQTDPNGNTTYYEYDALGRLSAIRDHERHLLKTYQYQ